MPRRTTFSKPSLVRGSLGLAFQEWSRPIGGAIHVAGMDELVLKAGNIFRANNGLPSTGQWPCRKVPSLPQECFEMHGHGNKIMDAFSSMGVVGFAERAEVRNSDVRSGGSVWDGVESTWYLFRASSGARSIRGQTATVGQDKCVQVLAATPRRKEVQAFAFYCKLPSRVQVRLLAGRQPREATPGAEIFRTLRDVAEEVVKQHIYHQGGG